MAFLHSSFIIVFRNHGLRPWVSGYAPAQLLTNCLSPYGGLPKAPCFARGCLLAFAPYGQTVMSRGRPGDAMACTRGGSRNPLYLRGFHGTFCIRRALRCLRFQVRCLMWEVECQMLGSRPETGWYFGMRNSKLLCPFFRGKPKPSNLEP